MYRLEFLQCRRYLYISCKGPWGRGELSFRKVVTQKLYPSGTGFEFLTTNIETSGSELIYYLNSGSPAFLFSVSKNSNIIEINHANP